MVGMRTAQCWCWPCLCQLPGMLCLQQARNAHPHPHPTKKPLFGGLQHNPLILCGILKGKTVVMLQKPEEVWGKGAVSWPLAAPKGLAQASVAIRQLTPTGLSLLRWPQKQCPFVLFMAVEYLFWGDIDLALCGQDKGKLWRQPYLGTRGFWWQRASLDKETTNKQPPNPTKTSETIKRNSSYEETLRKA